MTSETTLLYSSKKCELKKNEKANVECRTACSEVLVQSEYILVRAIFA